MLLPRQLRNPALGEDRQTKPKRGLDGFAVYPQAGWLMFYGDNQPGKILGCAFRLRPNAQEPFDHKKGKQVKWQLETLLFS
jgi:hypothetical protein